MQRPLRLILAALFAFTASPAAGLDETRGTGLPLPRFVSLRAGEVNMRTGPGLRYPVEWVYRRRTLPVEVIAEYATWRKVRDWQGAEGWVHQSMLDGRRTVIVTGQVRNLRRVPDAAAEPAARAEPGVIATVRECPTDGVWCRVEAEGIEGWLRRDEVWGVYPRETL